jgi:hypothetical protein
MFLTRGAVFWVKVGWIETRDLWVQRNEVLEIIFGLSKEKKYSRCHFFVFSSICTSGLSMCIPDRSLEYATYKLLVLAVVGQIAELAELELER